MNWRAALERTVTGLGYDLVDVARSAHGLLQVFIDRVPGHVYPTGESEFVTVEDCEAVTRQLQYVLEVEECDYQRLEVSSPGLDRLLAKASDYERFVGSAVNVCFKLPFKGRKNYRGTLVAGADGGWRLLMNEGKEELALDFVLDEVREARLVPTVNFKGRQARLAPARDAAAQEQVDGGRKE